MAAVTSVIPNLLGGISQQPDPIKIPGQVRDAVNTLLDPTFGCKKRPPTTYIEKLADDIPSTAKWFPIFRDSSEKYVACVYSNAGTPTVRVFDALTGIEKAVTQDESAEAYLEGADTAKIRNLSLADYTLICNPDRIVTMSDVALDNTVNEALVIINAVSYNTTYSIDFSKDGAAGVPVKVYRATGLEVIPGSYEVEDGGLCTQNTAQDHTVSSGSKTGLTFRIVNQCAAYYDAGSNAYRSRYQTSVILKNGGSGWQIGDEVTVTQAGKSFIVRVTAEDFEYTYASDGTATYTTPSDATSGTLSVSGIISNLVTAVNALTGYTADSIGNVIRIKRTDTRDFNLSVRGGSTNRAMTALKGSAQDVADLPSQCFPGFTLKVSNTQEAEADDYYVKFVSDTEGIPGPGIWEETVAPDIAVEINSSTMPHALVRLASGDFELKALNSSSALGGWAAREVGDEKTNPAPTFVGRGISDMFFYNNRLGFLSEDSCILSQPGDYFNFFNRSAITVSDADPIDVTASSLRPAILKAAIGTPKGLVLFAEAAQFMLATTEIQFGPATVKMTEISTYSYRSNARPINTGLSVMFVSEADTYSKVLEMAVDSSENRPQVAELTKIIPELVPPELKWSAISPNNSLATWGTGDDTLYTFRFYNVGNERKVAGWSKWVMPSDVSLFEFDNDTAYIVTFDGSNYILSQMEMLDDPATAPITSGINKFTPRLDFLVYKADTTIVDAGNGLEDKVYFPEGSFVAGAQPVLIVTSGTNVCTFVRPSAVNDVSGDYVLINKDLTSSDFIIGLEYQMRVELPSFYVTTEDRADRTFAPVVEFLNLDLYYSGRYTVEMEKVGYSNYTEDVDVTLANFYEANSVPLKEVETRTVPVFCKGSDVTVTITADDPVPAAITSYSWQGHYNRRGIASI